MAASSIRSAVSLLIVVGISALAQGQIVLYDFQNEIAENAFPETFGHFGTITLDSGLIQDCDGVAGEVCRFHVGNFDDLIPDPSRFGLIEIGPRAQELLLDVSRFDGYSVDARFIRDVDGPGGFDDFTGIAPLEIGLQWDPTDDCAGSMDACSDVYAEPVELTETFTTYTVMFDDFVPEGTPLNSVQIKMLLKTGVWDGSVLPAIKLKDISSGVGRLEFDNIVGILPHRAGDMDIDRDVDFDDIDDFVLGLSDPVEYESLHGVAPAFNGDIDLDGDVDFDDISGFVAILNGGSPAVPEPACCGLFLIGIAALAGVGRRIGS